MSLRIPPPLVALAGALLMWGIASWFPQLVFAFPFRQPLAYALGGAGLAFDLVSVAAFVKARTTVTPLAPEKASSLVTGGLYKFTRNPMYLGMLLVLTGIAMWFGSPLNVIVLIGFVAYITTFQIKPEEARLEEIFGADYRDYMQRVRRWL